MTVIRGSLAKILVTDHLTVLVWPRKALDIVTRLVRKEDAIVESFLISWVEEFYCWRIKAKDFIESSFSGCGVKQKRLFGDSIARFERKVFKHWTVRSCLANSQSHFYANPVDSRSESRNL